MYHHGPTSNWGKNLGFFFSFSSNRLECLILEVKLTENNSFARVLQMTSSSCSTTDYSSEQHFMETQSFLFNMNLQTFSFPNHTLFYSPGGENISRLSGFFASIIPQYTSIYSIQYNTTELSRRYSMYSWNEFQLNSPSFFERYFWDWRFRKTRCSYKLEKEKGCKERWRGSMVIDRNAF